MDLHSQFQSASVPILDDAHEQTAHEAEFEVTFLLRSKTCNPGNTAFLCGQKPDALNKFRLTHGIWQQPCQAPKLHWAD